MQRTSCIVAAVIAAACGSPRPLATVGPDLGKRVVAEHGVVATGNAYASEAGLAILERGGNAIDATVAAALVLGVTEPMMSGLGAGGGMLFWDAHRGAVEYLDFYSSEGNIPDSTLRPSSAKVSDSVLRATFSTATPRGVAIPGAVRGLFAAQAKYGKLSRADVMAPALALAQNGFTVTGLLAREIATSAALLKASPGASRLFLPDGKPLRAGDRLTQPELAATLRRIADQGPDEFYTGEIGGHIVEAMRAAGSTITREDFASYQPRWTRPVCATYHGDVVLSAAAPQSGMEVLEALNLLEPRHLTALGPPNRAPDAFRVLAGALRAAVTDRDAFVGDPDHAAVPMAGVTSRAFASTRATVVDSAVAGRLAPGDPWPYDAPPDGICAALGAAPPSRERAHAAALGRPAEGSEAETTHISVVDAEGNGVSLTNTLGLVFGTGTWVDGVFLNSGLFNFSRDPASPNAIGSWRMAASTIAPTIVLRHGSLQMVVGCPGSLAIPPAIVETIIYQLDFGLDPMQALRMPRLIPQPGAQLGIESGFADSVYAEARRLGYQVAVSPANDPTFGGVTVITRIGDRWVGAADPRRDGEVRGW